MKKTLKFYSLGCLITIIVLMLASCGTTSVTPSETISEPSDTTNVIESNIVVTCEPIIVLDAGDWILKVVLKEKDGVGVTFNQCVLIYYSDDGVAGEPHSYLTDAYVPAYGSVHRTFEIPVQLFAYGIITFTGIDDNGQEIIAEGRVEPI